MTKPAAVFLQLLGAMLVFGGLWLLVTGDVGGGIVRAALGVALLWWGGNRLYRPSGSSGAPPYPHL